MDASVAPAAPTTGLRGSRLWAFLQLVRVPNLFTAPADSLVGYLAVAGSSPDARSIAALGFASVALYAGGVAFNDYCDRALDAVERPERPLPSGRIRPGEALALVLGLYAVAILAAATVHPAAGLMALLLAGCASAYDAWFKPNWLLGPPAMGACRGLNVLMGAAAVPGALHLALPFAALLLVYIATVTALARGEVWGGTRRVAVFSMVIFDLVAVAVLVFVIVGWLPNPWAIPFVLIFALPLMRATRRVIQEPSPDRIRTAIVTGVLGLILLDAALVAGLAGPVVGVAVGLLIIPGRFVARLFAVT